MMIDGVRLDGLDELDDRAFKLLTEDPDAHLLELDPGKPTVCGGGLCRSYRKSREERGLQPDPRHKPGEAPVTDLLAEAVRRDVALVPVLRRIQRLFGDLGLVVHLYGRKHPLIEAVWADVACPRDTDGDGGCGMPACSLCGNPTILEDTRRSTSS